jgi:hypothetical protein
MADVEWSHHGTDACLRVRAAGDATLRVRAASVDVVGELPPMAGHVVRDGDDLCFVPRFPFVDGTSYTVMIDGVAVTTLSRERSATTPTTEVVAIHPTATTVPRNLLRCYVTFSAPMSEGESARHVRLLDGEGCPIDGALLPSEHELWDTERRRLTVLFDPARIKRGLVAHRTLGYPLRIGETFRLVVGSGFRDATGLPLCAGAEQRYVVGDDERRRIDPAAWALHPPRAGTRAPLAVAFDRPLDHALIARCLRVVDGGGAPIEGTADAGTDARSWTFSPQSVWAPGSHRLVIDPVLEDLAGNSVRRVFDRDLTLIRDRPDDAVYEREFTCR